MAKSVSLLVTSYFDGQVLCHASGFFLLPFALGQSEQQSFSMNSGLTLGLLGEMARGERRWDQSAHGLPILTVGHCLRPHKWRNLYRGPEYEWLGGIRGLEEQISAQLRLVDNEGETLASWAGYSRLSHATADLEAVSLLPRLDSVHADTLPRRGRGSPVARFADALLAAHRAGYAIDGVVQTELGWFDDDDVAALDNEQGPAVQLHGCQVLNAGLPNEWRQAESLGGRVAAVSRYQLFCRMERPPQQGMCGGPVRNRRGQLVGMLEGLVNPLPADQPHALLPDSPEIRLRQSITGCAAVIPQSVLHAFINDVQRFSANDDD